MCGARALRLVWSVMQTMPSAGLRAVTQWASRSGQQNHTCLHSGSRSRSSSGEATECENETDEATDDEATAEAEAGEEEQADEEVVHESVPERDGAARLRREVLRCFRARCGGFMLQARLTAGEPAARSERMARAEVEWVVD